MSPLRAALVLILASSATCAWAEQITCESRQERTEACGTVAAGSSVTLSQQLSNTPCVEGQNWGTGPNRDSIWVSGGCRAVFDVQPPYNSTADQNNYDSGQQVVRDDGERYQDSRDPRDQGYRDNGRDEAQYGDSRSYSDQDRRDDDRSEGTRYASVDRNRSIARRACVDQAASNQSYRRDDIRATDVQWIGHGMFSVSLDTPDGSMTCTVDRDGNVTALNSR